MGVTDSTDLIDEHWMNQEPEQPLHPNEEEEEQEKERGLSEKLSSIDASLSVNNGLLRRKQEKHCTEEEERTISAPNEDELNEEKMWIDAISLEPKSSALRNQLANHYFSQHRLREAEFAYLAAMALDETNGIAHYDYAFMRHHQFYWCLAKSDMKSGYKYAKESAKHYASVLSLDENDIETHYQLSLLYLTMLETTLIESIDNIESALISGIYRCNRDKYRGKYSPWYQDISEIHKLCTSHLKITLDSCSRMSAVLFGTYITSSRLLYIECIPNPFIYFSLSAADKKRKLNLAISYLNLALEINDCDATAHHDLALILSHDAIGNYNDAIYHWLCANELDGANPIYTQQIAYIYQYSLTPPQYGSAIKYYNISLQLYDNNVSNHRNNSCLASIWNNLGIISAQSAKKQSDVMYARKCWNKCLSIFGDHCEAHRNLGNILWLHFYDENTAEIHLQRAIAISSQIYNDLETIACAGNGNDLYSSSLRDKFASFLGQSKSDYGGLLLMMFKYDLLAEKELTQALKYDSNCVSAHYYLGKYLFSKQDLKSNESSIAHLHRYIELEQNNGNNCNIANRAHSHQILGEIYLRQFGKFSKAQFHFAEAINLTQNNDNLLPIWAKCKIHCGFADCIIKYELARIYDDCGAFKSQKTRDLIAELRSKLDSKLDCASKLKENIEIAKKHYRLILKLDCSFVGAPLGLAAIFGKIEGKIKLSEKHYNDCIRLCRAKLIKLNEKYQMELKREMKDKKLNEIQQKKIEKYYKKLKIEKKEKELEEIKQEICHKELEECANNNKFSSQFKLNLTLLDSILNSKKKSQNNICVIRIVRELREFVLLCMESHLGKVDLIMISCHNNKWKEALAHCNKIIYLDETNIVAHYKKALLQNKVTNDKEKAKKTAKYALDLIHQQEKTSETTNKEEHINIIKHHLNDIIEQ